MWHGSIKLTIVSSDFQLPWAFSLHCTIHITFVKVPSQVKEMERRVDGKPVAHAVGRVAKEC